MAAQRARGRRRRRHGNVYIVSVGESVGGIEWSWRTSTLHHDRQINLKIVRDGSGVTVDLGRGLDMYYAAHATGETQANNDTLRARETVVWTRS